VNAKINITLIAWVVSFINKTYNGKRMYEILAKTPSYKCINEFLIGFFQNKNDNIELINNKNANMIS
jgi:hypothetical protein